MEKPGGPEEVMSLYYGYWLHGDQTVTVRRESMAGGGSGGEVSGARVKRLDDFGYLVVELPGGGGEATVHPDGNSFDMMQGLIMPKVVEDKPAVKK